MFLPDVNVLIYAHRREANEHDRYAAWLKELATGLAPFGLSELVLSGFIRVVTQSRFFDAPTSRTEAFHFVNNLIQRPLAVVVRPGERHFAIFEKLCESTDARGKLVADAYHAALAIEHGCEWVTTDSDFGRFKDLRTVHPLRSNT